MQLFSGSTNCCATGVFHITSNFLSRSQHITLCAPFVRHAVQRQVHDLTEMWLENIPLFFSFTHQSRWHRRVRILNSIHSCYVRVWPLCLPATQHWLLMCFQGPAGLPNLSRPFSLFLLHTIFFFFLHHSFVAPFSFLEGSNPSKCRCKWKCPIIKVHWTSY